MAKQQIHDLKFSVENIGSVINGEFIHKPLTVFCGANNSGKTWVMYALHAFYSSVRQSYLYNNRMTDSLPSSPELPYAVNKQQQMPVLEMREPGMYEELSSINKILAGKLPEYLNVPSGLLGNASFSLSCDERQWQGWIANNHGYKVFLIPSERNGLNIFYRELTARRTALLHNASREGVDVEELLRDVMHTRYARPIADYIDWLNSLTAPHNYNSGVFHKEALFVQRELAQGKYKVDRQTGDISFKPNKSGGTASWIGLHAASGAAKSLFALWFYLEHQAKAGDVLMIDEPELNIHPGRQLVIVNLLARLVNAGIRVVISTHSDYIVREFNNLIMLGENKEKSGKLMKEFGYKENATLKPEQVGSYFFANNTITEFKYTSGQGFAISTFDEVIKRQNKSNSAIYFGLMPNEPDE